MVQVGSAEICPTCRKVIRVFTTQGEEQNKLAIGQYQLERVYKAGQNIFELKEFRNPTKDIKNQELPKSDYNPDLYVERETRIF